MTNEVKLNGVRRMIFEVWDALVPDYPVEDEYYQQIGATAERLIGDIQEMQRFVDEFNDRGSPKWNPDLV
jgi:hypothetical protein